MKKSIFIWAIILGASFFCIDIVLKVKNIDSIFISSETAAENSEKDDIDEGIIYFSQLIPLTSSKYNTKQYAFKLISNTKLPELRPPCTA